MEADEVADGKAHKREVGGALAEMILLVSDAEYPVEAGSGELQVSAQQLLPSIRGASFSWAQS